MLLVGGAGIMPGYRYLGGKAISGRGRGWPSAALGLCVISRRGAGLGKASHLIPALMGRQL